jgi:hypothetical protein
MPFCQRSIGTDFDIIMMHAESLGSTRPKVGQDVNMYAFMAKHKVFGIHMCCLRGDIKPLKITSPKFEGPGHEKERKRHRLEAMRRG